MFKIYWLIVDKLVEENLDFNIGENSQTKF